MDECLLCGEEVMAEDQPTAGSMIFGPTGVRGTAHKQCLLREVLGGIGHLLDHEFWCVRQHDPDAGLTYRTSALMVWEWVQERGIENVAGEG